MSLATEWKACRHADRHRAVRSFGRESEPDRITISEIPQAWFHAINKTGSSQRIGFHASRADDCARCNPLDRQACLWIQDVAVTPAIHFEEVLVVAGCRKRSVT